MGEKGTYGAAFVSSRICLSFNSLGSGRCWRCFSREFWRTWFAGRTGAMGLSSMTESRDSAMFVFLLWTCVVFEEGIESILEFGQVGRGEERKLLVCFVIRLFELLIPGGEAPHSNGIRLNADVHFVLWCFAYKTTPHLIPFHLCRHLLIYIILDTLMMQQHFHLYVLKFRVTLARWLCNWSLSCLRQIQTEMETVHQLLLPKGISNDEHYTGCLFEYDIKMLSLLD